MPDPKQWICGTLDTPGAQRAQGSPTAVVPMGVVDPHKLWEKNSVLKIRFLGGSAALQDRVLESARAWLAPGIKLDMARAATGEKAQIRISFNAGGGSWSYVGTDALGIHPAQATMNLGWATLDTPKDDFDSVVIHEFGHALGLLHEHNHPLAQIPWNKPAVYADLQGEPNNWDKQTIDDNVFAKFGPENVATPFDAVSVMIYTVPSAWTTDGKSFMPSPRLSKGDAATIKKLYG